MAGRKSPGSGPVVVVIGDLLVGLEGSPLEPVTLIGQALDLLDLPGCLQFQIGDGEAVDGALFACFEGFALVILGARPHPHQLALQLGDDVEELLGDGEDARRVVDRLGRIEAMHG
jgi:hypothetical protein